MALNYTRSFPCPTCGKAVVSYHSDVGEDDPEWRAPTHWIFEPCGHKFLEFTMDVTTGMITKFTPMLSGPGLASSR